MADSAARTAFAKALLDDVAPQEAEFFDAYDAATSGVNSTRRAGTGMGFPPEVAGVLGMVAVIVGRTVFDKLWEWTLDAGGAIAKKFIVDTSVERLKKWLGAPQKSGLGSILSAQGRLEILAVAERDARSAKLAPEEIERLLKSVAARLDG